MTDIYALDHVLDGDDEIAASLYLKFAAIDEVQTGRTFGFPGVV